MGGEAELLAGLPQGSRPSRSRRRPGAAGQVGRGRGGPGLLPRRAPFWRIFLQSQDLGVLCVSAPPSPGLQFLAIEEAASGILGSGRVIPLRVPPGDSGKACFMSWQSDHSRARFLFLAASVSLDPAHCLQSGLRNRSRRSVCFQSSPYILLLCFCCRTTSGQRKWQRRSFEFRS